MNEGLRPGQLLPEFVAARGLAAMWILCAHTLANLLHQHGELPAAVEYSRIVVDFFFVQSGFVLAHMYDAAWRSGRFDYRGFLARRLVRLYPVHLATLVGYALLVEAGRSLGAEPENPHTAWVFLMHALMLHSAWTTPAEAWNWPSWSVSAEWCAYLALPLIFALADRCRGLAMRVAAALASFLVAAAIATFVIGQDLVTLTFDGGALRIFPSFLTGILLRRMFDDDPRFMALGPRGYATVVAGVAAVCAVLIALGAPYMALWPPMLVLVAALVSRATRPEPGLLRGRVLAWLGDLSYAIYMTHALVLLVFFAGAERLGLAETLGQRAAIGVAAIVGTLLAAQCLYLLVELPGRRIMARILRVERRSGGGATTAPPKPVRIAGETGRAES